MTITLYHNTSEQIRLHKVLTEIVTLNGTLRAGTSLTAPEIVFELTPETLHDYVRADRIVDDNGDYVLDDNGNYIGFSFLAEVLAANYMRIPDFNRYYFIRDIVSVNKNLWLIRCERSDVLMSFKPRILTLHGIVARNEKKFNAYIDDITRTFNADNVIEEFVPTTTTGVTLTTFDPKRAGAYGYPYNIVVNINGYGYSGSLWQYAEQQQGDGVLPDVNIRATGQNSPLTCSMVVDSDNFQVFAKGLIDHAEYASQVNSIVVFPFPIAGNTTLLANDFPFKGGSITGVRNMPVDKGISPYMLVADFTVDGKYGNYIDIKRTTYEMYLPYCSWVQFSAEQILGARIRVYYVVDYNTGGASIVVTAVKDFTYRVLLETTCQLGVVIPVNTSNASDIARSRFSNGLNLALGLLSSGAALATGNPVGLVSGAMKGAHALGSFITGEVNAVIRGQGSVSSGNAGLYSPQQVRIRRTYAVPTDTDEHHAKLFGLPLCEYNAVHDLEGMTIFSDIHVEGIDNALDNEVQELESLLKSGIII